MNRIVCSVVAGLVLLLSNAATAATAILPPLDPHMAALAERVLVASGNDARVSAATRAASIHDTLANAIAKTIPGYKPDWKPVVDEAVDAEIRAQGVAFFEENRRIYATQFTEAELNDMLTFYASPGGKALVAQTPAIIAEKVAWGRQLGEASMARLMKAVCSKEPC